MQLISLEQLETLMKKNQNVTVINVLSKESFDQEHVPGSINIPFDEEKFLEQIKKKFANMEQQIVVYCASLECPVSTKAAKALEEAGYTQVLDFKGGMQEWKQAGKRGESLTNSKNR